MESHRKAQTKTDDLLDALDWLVWLGGVSKDYVGGLGFDDALRRPGRSRLRHELAALEINKKKKSDARPLPIISLLLALAQLAQNQILERVKSCSQAADPQAEHIGLASLSLAPRILAQRPQAAARPRAGLLTDHLI